MLEALYQYAKDNALAAIPGFKPKKVRHYISLSADGTFLGFDPVPDGAMPPMCPDIGSLANGKTKSNVIVEKAEVILNLPDKDGNCNRGQKQAFFFDALQQAAEYDALFRPAADRLEEQLDMLRLEFAKLSKTKPSDFIGIKVDGMPLEQSKGYLAWWDSFRKSFDTKKSAGEMRCFITGTLTEPVKTVPPVQGLIAVGGHTKGDSFICFDKDAYCSYEFRQAANACVSEEAVTAVNAALAKLMKDATRPLAGAKNIHWFSEATEHDPLEILDFGFGGDMSGEQQEQLEEDERRVQRMFRSLLNGTLPEMPKNRYYMMSLSGVNGRAMIRSYTEGTYDALCGNLRAWYEDLKITDPGYGCRYPKLFGVYSRLLKWSANKQKLDERIKDELSGLAPQIMYAILHNTPLPDTVAAKALSYIRSDLYGHTDDSSKQPSPDRSACQILKAWLNRRYRTQNKEESIIMEKLNPESPSIAYQTGRLMAAYASIQNAALGDVGAGIIERYYTSACASPALVMGRLATMSQHHLSKLRSEKPGLFHIYSGLLEEISVCIGTTLPKTFTLEQQSEFALGYYFQNAEIHARKAQSKKTEE